MITEIHLKILLPTHIFFEDTVKKITAEAQNGQFCLLPRHQDFVTALVPNILLIELPNGTQQFIALDSGILVKKMKEVFISTKHATRSKELEPLKKLVMEKYKQLGDEERITRDALARLEANTVRYLADIKGASNV